MTKKQKTIKLYNVVRLKSGGPNMTVIDKYKKSLSPSRFDKWIDCKWFDSGHIRLETFDERELVKQ